MNRFIPRVLMAPAVVTLLLWMLVPLVMTIYFSLIRYNLMQPDQTGYIGPLNYEFFVTDPQPGERKVAVGKAVPLGAMGQPADVAGAAVFLASAAAGYITAQTLDVDGGNVKS